MEPTAVRKRTPGEDSDHESKKKKPEVDLTAIVSSQATLRGKVIVGSETVIGPGCIVEALQGEIVLGRRNIVDDGARITHASEGTLFIGEGNRFEAACDLNCPSFIGNFNVVETKAVICPGSALGDGCFICAGVTVPQNTKLGAGETFFSQQAERWVDPDAPQVFAASLQRNLPFIQNALRASASAGAKQ